METSPSTRTYALTKLAAGDYLLPSNDGQRLYRIQRYVDGGTAGLERDDGTPVPDFTAWSVRELIGGTERARRFSLADLSFDDVWRFVSDDHRTRQAAIDAALR